MNFVVVNMLWTQEGSQNEENSDDDDDESPEISKWESIIWLSIMTAWISFLSEYLVNAIEVSTSQDSVLGALILLNQNHSSLPPSFYFYSLSATYYFCYEFMWSVSMLSRLQVIDL